MDKNELIEKKMALLESVINRHEAGDNEGVQADDVKEHLNTINIALATLDKLEKEETSSEETDRQFLLKKLEIESKVKVEEVKAEAAKDCKVPLSKQALEWAKVIVPTIVPVIAYGIFQHKMLKFEETGTIHSKTGRDMHLPKF